MKNRFNKWLRTWGQPVGFLSIVVYLNAYGYIFSDRMRVGDDISSLLALGFIVQFFGLSLLWVWVMKKMGWSLPKSVRETHS
tara:strand:+ start:110 stop:355 length:246 start_codon:yes stop_codon:yes gene_type:complete